MWAQDLLVRIRVCGRCGTDATIYRQGHARVDPNAPVVLGHELVGEVVQVGEDVRNLREGIGYKQGELLSPEYLDFQLGDRITLARKYSADGADEPSTDWMPDGRMFCILRARNLDHPQMEIPSSKCYSLSEDNGWTWSPGEPLLYDDGGYVLSPASLANVFRSSKNGRFYIITNFIDESAYNCDPRTQLQIAELDTDALRVIRDSVTVIDEREGDEPEYIRFSNFRWYEDRETQDIALYMAHNAGDTGRSDRCGTAPHAYRYDIRLPDE